MQVLFQASPALGIGAQQVRNLAVHEHISMKILQDAGVPVPIFGVANTPKEARAAAEKIGLCFWQGTAYALRKVIALRLLSAGKFSSVDSSTTKTEKIMHWRTCTVN